MSLSTYKKKKKKGMRHIMYNKYNIFYTDNSPVALSVRISGLKSP